MAKKIFLSLQHCRIFLPFFVCDGDLYSRECYLCVQNVRGKQGIGAWTRLPCFALTYLYGMQFEPIPQNKALHQRQPLGGAEILSSSLCHGPPWASLNGADCVVVGGVCQAQGKIYSPRFNCVLKKKKTTIMT